MTAPAHIGTAAVVRLGLAQMAIGATVALMTSTLNRVMVVELGLPASVPGALVALHFAVQLARARVGFASDRAARRTPWMAGGMVALAAGGVGAVLATALLAVDRALGLAAAAAAYLVIGLGVSAAGTSLLALVAERVAPARLGRAAAILWVMMIAGIVVSAGAVGTLLDPFDLRRMVVVCSGACVAALLVGLLGVWGVEPATPAAERRAEAPVPFADAVRAALAERATRRFAAFVFVSMLAYSAQDLILEPFAGTVFGLTPGASTRLGGVQHVGVLLGMLVAAAPAARGAALRRWAAGGCIASAVAFLALAASPLGASPALLTGIVLALGLANGAFAIGAVGAMMASIGERADGRAGLHMGIFGAAQAVAYALGGLTGGAASDAARALLGSAAAGYATVFVGEALLFAVAARLAVTSRPAPRVVHAPLSASDGEHALALLH
ncbi:MAG: BCD family MFS transporter [Gemmatirosa sp.]